VLDKQGLIISAQKVLAMSWNLQILEMPFEIGTIWHSEKMGGVVLVVFTILQVAPVQVLLST